MHERKQPRNVSHEDSKHTKYFAKMNVQCPALILYFVNPFVSSWVAHGVEPKTRMSIPKIETGTPQSPGPENTQLACRVAAGFIEHDNQPREPQRRKQGRKMNNEHTKPFTKSKGQSSIKIYSARQGSFREFLGVLRVFVVKPDLAGLADVAVAQIAGLGALLQVVLLDHGKAIRRCQFGVLVVTEDAEPIFGKYAPLDLTVRRSEWRKSMGFLHVLRDFQPAKPLDLPLWRTRPDRIGAPNHMIRPEAAH
jgi:hypothetical protein